MKKKKVFISLIVLLVIISIITLIFLLNSSKKSTLVYDQTLKNGTFEYEQSITNESIESIYYYSDSYFEQSGEKENSHLRTFALSLALSFNPTYRKDKTNYNIDKLLKELDFSDIEYHDLDEFCKDTIGTSLAHKKLNSTYELVTVVLRGAGYSKEWESNLDLGESGHAKGFNEAADKVLIRLKDYLKENEIDKYKILIVGYSRAGAVSGLVGVKLNNNLEEYNIEKDDIYTYTYEAPNASSDNKIYKNIHNVVNKNDIVTYVYPESFGLHQNGIEEDITTSQSKIKEKYLSLLSSEKIKDLDEIDKQDFIKEFLNLFPKNRIEYNKASQNIINLYDLFNRKTSMQKEKIINYLKKIDISFDLGNLYNINVLLSFDDEEKIKDAFNRLTESYDKNYKEIKDVLYEEEFKYLKEDIFNIFMFIRPVLKTDYNNNYMFYHILTFSSNINEIFKEHYFSINLEQVKSKDSYYQ